MTTTQRRTYLRQSVHSSRASCYGMTSCQHSCVRQHLWPPERRIPSAISPRVGRRDDERSKVASTTMAAVGVWESRGPDIGVIGDDRPRDFRRTGGARLADLQIQRDVDRASPARALPQRPRGYGTRSRNSGSPREAEGEIQRDVDRASPARALPQRPRGYGTRSRNSGSPREAEGEPCTCWPPFPPSVSSSTMHRYGTGLKPLQQSR